MFKSATDGQTDILREALHAVARKNRENVPQTVQTVNN